MTSVYLACVIQSSVVHTHVHAKDVGKIDRSSHASLIRADDHEMFIVDMESFLMFEKSLDKLVSRLDGLKTVKRCSVLYTGIVCIKGDDVFYAHAGQFLKCRSTVQGFTAGTLALAALIKVWHDNVDTACLTADSCNHTLQILEVVIW